MNSPQKETKKEEYYSYSYGKFKLAGYIENDKTTDTKIKTTRNKYKSSESSHI